MLNLKPSVPSNIVLIGASTGGPGQIQEIISALQPLDYTTIVIAQHMANEFIPSFAKRMQEHSKSPLSMINDNSYLESGNIYICSGHTKIVKRSNELYFTRVDSQKNSYNPSIDTVFNSLVPYANNFNILCAILTGIGDDGVDGCNQLSLNGARCITEDSQSAIVDGMPSRAREKIKNIEVLSLNKIINTIREFSS